MFLHSKTTTLNSPWNSIYSTELSFIFEEVYWYAIIRVPPPLDCAEFQKFLSLTIEPKGLYSPTLTPYCSAVN